MNTTPRVGSSKVLGTKSRIGIAAAALVAVALGVGVWLHRPGAAPKPETAADAGTEASALNEPLEAPELTPELREALQKYVDMKQEEIGPEELSQQATASFAGKGMLMIAQQFIPQGSESDTFVKEEADTRVLLIDYLGDAALGRFDYEDREKAQAILFWLLDLPISIEGKEKLQGRALLGARVGLMAYYTQTNAEAGKAYLLRHRGEKIYGPLEAGYATGLSWLGRSQDEVKQEIMAIRNAPEEDPGEP